MHIFLLCYGWGIALRSAVPCWQRFLWNEIGSSGFPKVSMSELRNSGHHPASAPGGGMAFACGSSSSARVWRHNVDLAVLAPWHYKAGPALFLNNREQLIENCAPLNSGLRLWIWAGARNWTLGLKTRPAKKPSEPNSLICSDKRLKTIWWCCSKSKRRYLLKPATRRWIETVRYLIVLTSQSVIKSI